MKISLLRPFLRFVLFSMVSAASLFAAELPKFSAPEVNTFVRDYSAYTDESIAMNKEILANPSKMDSTKMQALMAKAEGMMTTMTAMETKLKPDEKVKFEKFIADCGERINDAMKR